MACITWCLHAAHRVTLTQLPTVSLHSMPAHLSALLCGAIGQTLMGSLALTGQLPWTDPRPTHCQCCRREDLTVCFCVISEWLFVVDAVGMAEASACQRATNQGSADQRHVHCIVLQCKPSSHVSPATAAAASVSHKLGKGDLLICHHCSSSSTHLQIWCLRSAMTDGFGRHNLLTLCIQKCVHLPCYLVLALGLPVIGMLLLLLLLQRVISSCNTSSSTTNCLHSFASRHA